jgi:hypothetical protein
MKSTRSLPQHYRLFKRLSIRENAPLLMLNIVSLAALGLMTVFLLLLIGWTRPGDVADIFTISIEGTSNFLVVILILLAATAAMMVVHEAFHGLCFWYFTGTRPKYGFRGAYAFAAAPDWYISRTPYLITSLAPLIGITLIGMVLLVWMPARWVPLIMLVVALNASGAVGDLWVAWWLLRCPAEAFGNDQGDVTSLYIPGEVQSESR